MYLICKLIAVLYLVTITMNTRASDLAVKYYFVPSHESKYKTSVVKPALKAKKLQTKIINSATQNISKVQPNVQVVAVREYANKQPLDPTISYSYSKASASIAPASVVIAAKNYHKREVELMTSNLHTDLVQTYVVGFAYNDKGYDQQSKGELQSVQSKIAANPLIGCAPLSVTCERTATDSNKLNADQSNLNTTQPKVDNQRQQLTP